MDIYRERDRLDPAERAPLLEAAGACACEDAELDVEDAFGEHDIEYWVRRGNRLVPATAEDVAHIQEYQRELIAGARLERWQREETRRSPWPARLLGGVLRAWRGPARGTSQPAKRRRSGAKVASP